MRCLFVVCLACLGMVRTSWSVPAQVVITEIMYHPVEEPAFNADGSPVLDLYEDVHEFVELFNPGASPVPIGKWQLTGGIRFEFPVDASIASGGYLVVAKDPVRLRAVPQYDLAGVMVLGPYQGQLSNQGDTIHLQDAGGSVVDSVSYSAEFPWPMSADALGADEDWTGLKAADYQDRGRSLERVSWSQASNDPANWLASPLAGNPSPGRPNAIERSVPQPVVVELSISQELDGARLIRQNEPVRLRCRLSSNEELSNLGVEWFSDDLERTNEATTITPLVSDGPGPDSGFSAVLPGQPDRTLIRYRIRGNRGAGDEVISPRADDPFAWHAYFVTPVRTSTRPVYDCLISSRSLEILRTNISQDPRRVTTPDPPGNPRPSWNATEPGVVVENGVVYDVRLRYHGSRYNRSAERNSFKWQFPRYRKFHGVSGIFETDKGDDFVVGHGLFRAAGFPVSAVRYVDLYLNNQLMQRLEQGEYNGEMLDEYHRDQQASNPGTKREPTGELYKVEGTIDEKGEGPYGRGDGRPLSKPPYWTDLQMYEWTYALQNHGWRGSFSWKQMIDQFWAARGDTPARPAPNVPALRAFFQEHFDADEMLSYIALENWCCPWDDTTQNHFFWQRRSGKWGMLPWDCDLWFGKGDNTPPTSSIFIGEVGDPNNNFRGPNFFKDGFIKAFRDELKERFFLLNNTFLHPDNLTALGFGSIRNFAEVRMASVNEQCGLGVFQRPDKPVALAPRDGATALPPQLLSATPYAHGANPARPHARTIWEIRSATGTYLAPVWRLSSSTELTSVAIPFERLRFGQPYFWRCTYEDADGHPSLSSDEVSFSFGPASGQVNASTGPLVLNEIAARNTGSIPHEGGTPDWIELINRSDVPISLSDYSLTDDVLNPSKFTFPPTEVIPAHAYFLVWCDSNRSAPGLHTGFGLSDEGETVLLLKAESGAWSIADSVSFGPQAADLTIARVPDGAGAWSLAVPTPGAVNRVQSLGSVASLKINEWMASPVTGADWLELYNSGDLPASLAGLGLTDNAAGPINSTLAPLSFVAPHGYVKLVADGDADQGAAHLGFKLSTAGESLALYASDGLTLIDSVRYGPQDAEVSQGRLPDGAETIVAFPNTASPGGPNQLGLVTWSIQAGKSGVNEIAVHVVGSGTETVVLQASTDLQQWTDILTHPGAEGAFSYTETPARQESRRYFRLLTRPAQ